MSSSRALPTSNIHKPGTTKGLSAATSSRSHPVAGLDCEDMAHETPTDASTTNPLFPIGGFKAGFNGGPSEWLPECLCRGEAVPPGDSPFHRADSRVR